MKIKTAILVLLVTLMLGNEGRTQLQPIGPLATNRFGPPAYRNVAPAYTNVAPAYTNVAPVYTNVAPVYTNVAPQFTNFAPVFTNFAPGPTNLPGGLRNVPPRSTNRFRTNFVGSVDQRRADTIDQ